jgi:hypothetical protein
LKSGSSLGSEQQIPVGGKEQALDDNHRIPQVDDDEYEHDVLESNTQTKFSYSVM